MSEDSIAIGTKWLHKKERELVEVNLGMDLHNRKWATIKMFATTGQLLCCTGHQCK